MKMKKGDLLTFTHAKCVDLTLGDVGVVIAVKMQRKFPSDGNLHEVMSVLFYDQSLKRCRVAVYSMDYMWKLLQEPS